MPAEIVHLLNNPRQYVATIRNGEIYIALRHHPKRRWQWAIAKVVNRSWTSQPVISKGSG